MVRSKWPAVNTVDRWCEREHSAYVLGVISRKLLWLGLGVCAFSVLFGVFANEALIALHPVSTPTLERVVTWSESWQHRFVVPFSGCLVALGCALRIGARVLAGRNAEGQTAGERGEPRPEH